MKAVVLGASGRTGRKIAEALVADGHEVTSLGRSDPGVAGVTHVAARPDDAGALAEAARGAEAVFSALASTNSEAICSATTRALIGTGFAPRYVVVGGAGVDVPGDAKGLADAAIGGLMKLFVGRMLADRQREWEMLDASLLPYTFLRPPRLTDGPATGGWRFSDDRPASTAISRADLALAAVEAAGRADMVRRAPFVAR